MAKYHEVFEDIQTAFESRINEIDSLAQLNIKIIGCNTHKEIGTVKKASDVDNYKNNDDVNIFLNEFIFEQLSDDQKQIVMEELIAQIYVDDNNRLKIVKPDMPAGFSLVMLKHGLETYTNTKLLIKELFAQREQEDAENND